MKVDYWENPSFALCLAQRHKHNNERKGGLNIHYSTVNILQLEAEVDDVNSGKLHKKE